MSSIASCTLLPIGQLDALRAAAVTARGSLFRRTTDRFHEFLAATATSRSESGVAGYYTVMALTWLEEKASVDLASSSYDELAGFLA